MALNVYVDGACSNNGTPDAESSLGMWVENMPDLTVSKKLEGVRHTNQAAELYALKEALTSLNDIRHVRIHTDSLNAILSVTEWAKSQEPKGWVTSKGKPVLNLGIIIDIVRMLRDAEANGRKVELIHVKGHSNVYGNEMAHNLAQRALGK